MQEEFNMENRTLELAYLVLTGKKSLRDLTVDECLSIIKSFYGCQADEYRDAASSDIGDGFKLGIMRNGAKMALSRAEENTEYIAYRNLKSE